MVQKNIGAKKRNTLNEKIDVTTKKKEKKGAARGSGQKV
jgi:hypothetical protein